MKFQDLNPKIWISKSLTAYRERSLQSSVRRICDRQMLKLIKMWLNVAGGHTISQEAEGSGERPQVEAKKICR